MTLLQLLYGTWQHVVDCFKSAQRRALFDGMFRYCYETLGFLHPDSLYGRARDNVVVPRRTHWQGPPSPPPDSISRGKKKALLIGINYKLSPEHHDFGGLDGPHDDVDKMAEFLEEYGFDDIVIMKDTPEAGALAPTRDNIVCQIKKLVETARAGDSLVFLYSGHSDQVKALHDKNEEDGKDEVIIPMDHDGIENRDLLLVDDDLRRLLVDPLPLHSKLTAVFDSCHSGTLLDLDHDKCNDVFPADKLFQVVRTVTRVRSVFRRRIYTKSRVHPNVIQTRRLSLEVRTSTDGLRNETCTIESSVSTYEVSPLPMGVSYRLPGMGATRSSTKDITVQLPPLNTQLKVMGPRRKCTGMCITSPTIRQNVVSISACKDNQNTIEDENGCSLSRALIDVLRQNDQLSYHELLHQLRVQVNQTCIKMHEWYHQEGYTCQGGGSPLKSPTTGNTRPRPCTASVKSFYTWQPQLASLKRLNLNDRFSLTC